MSILVSFDQGWLISHEKYINSFYSDVQFMERNASYHLVKGLFNIGIPFKKPKQQGVKRSLKRPLSEKHFAELKVFSDLVQNSHQGVKRDIQLCLQKHFTFNENDDPLVVASKIYDESSKISLNNFVGSNADVAKCVTVNGENYLFPKNCKFYCKPVAEIESYFINIKYDLILLDPPWWNKYIRRKKAKTNHGYSMMYNSDLKAIPIENLLNPDGVVVVWCTNSPQNIEDLTSIFIKWNVHLAARWFWLKVTLEGDPICDFSEPPGKQPFEQIVIGVRNKGLIGRIPNHKIVFSVPSALHSHKPPLFELFREFIPEEPNCLELFARYLLPNWTSWGLEAIKFQHESLFEAV